MSDFQLWFNTGFTHILDINGYDHILFVTLLVFSFSTEQIKKLFWLITAFTLGHSITLAISALNLISLPQPIIELFISLSILITACFHLFKIHKNSNYQLNFMFIITLLFGLIHGLGFSYLLKNMLGKEENIAFPLLYFNIGLEAGQLVIVATVLTTLYFLIRVLQLKFESIKKVVAIVIGGISLYLIYSRV